MRHSITNADPENRRGTCSQCGPVKIYKGNKYKNSHYWRCGSYELASAKKRFSEPESQDRYRDLRFQRKFGITLAQYEEMNKQQGGKCARCKDSLYSGPYRLAVDHCHKTGVVRKLLCGPCNTYLGRLEANLHMIERDIHYLNSGSFDLDAADEFFALPIAARIADAQAAAAATG